jgi:ABC-type nickel/cobalt efflux system permease component RcnA
MSSSLLLGFLIGMRHALEADHLAAVAALTARSRSVADAVKQGAVWGLGHTAALFLFGSIVLVADSIVPDRLAHALELAVGVMLILLGMDVLTRLYRGRIHIHVHGHGDGKRHVHAHAHPTTERHDPERHHHPHAKAFPSRALFVGLMHGMAGSAALILLTLQSVQSALAGMGFMALFGVGSIAGMAAISVVIALPLKYQAKASPWLHNALYTAVGCASMVLGATLLYELTPLFLAGI